MDVDLGEIALSMLARSQNHSSRADIIASNRLWRELRLLYIQRQTAMEDVTTGGEPPVHSRRYVGLFSFSL